MHLKILFFILFLSCIIMKKNFLLFYFNFFIAQSFDRIKKDVYQIIIP